MYSYCTVVIDGKDFLEGEERIARAVADLGCTAMNSLHPAKEVHIDLVVVVGMANCLERIGQFRSRSTGNYLPVIAYLESCSDALRNHLYCCGAHDVIDDGITANELTIRLRNALESRICFRQLMAEQNTLQQEVARRAELLEETRLEITRRLGRAAEFRDNETGHHVLRVSKTTEIVARALGLKSHNVDLIAHASPLHDIGKIGIPDGILLKPGKLTEPEWRVMKRHTVIGARILAGSDEPLMRTATAIALTHHERWDGGGYPRRLRGDRIPLAGRIVAVCDVFDALTSVRPYKVPWSQDQAFNYIKENAGSQFDPMVVAAFMESRPHIAHVTTTFAEPTTVNSSMARYNSRLIPKDWSCAVAMPCPHAMTNGDQLGVAITGN